MTKFLTRKRGSKRLGNRDPRIGKPFPVVTSRKRPQKISYPKMRVPASINQIHKALRRYKAANEEHIKVMGEDFGELEFPDYVDWIEGKAQTAFGKRRLNELSAEERKKVLEYINKVVSITKKSTKEGVRFGIDPDSWFPELANQDNPGHNPREIVEEKFGVPLLRRAPPTPESIEETKRILKQEIHQAKRAVDEGKFDQALTRIAYARDTIELGPAHDVWGEDAYFRKVMKSLGIIKRAIGAGDKQTAKTEIRELAEIN